jgi:hypothetical protein
MIHNTVACLLKAGIAEPIETPVARQWLGKHISLEMDMHMQQRKNWFKKCFLLDSP